MKNTAIEWADHTFNPWVGCTKVSPACDHCYAENLMSSRMHVVQWGTGQPRKRTSARTWNDPLRWNAEAERLGVRYRVFCASLADVFDNEVPLQWRQDLFELIGRTLHLDWLLLTKRIGNAKTMMADALSAFPSANRDGMIWPLPNVWLGATICDQTEADRDVPKLLDTPAARRFVSLEPLLGPVNLNGIGRYTSGWRNIDALRGIDTHGHLAMSPSQCSSMVSSVIGAPKLDWVIVGGESGAHARPMHPEWVRALRDQCVDAGVPFLFKQHGEWLATEFCDDDMAMIPSKKTVYVCRDGSFHDGSNGVNFFGGDQETAWVGKKGAGRVLDGRTWDEVPA